jgi:hypothetical protein
MATELTRVVEETKLVPVKTPALRLTEPVFPPPVPPVGMTTV